MKKVDKKVPRITMRVSILAVFLSLVLSAFAVVLAYLEYENKGIVKELSEDVMQEKQNDLNSDVKDFFGSAENLVLTGSKLVSSADQISTKSEQLLSYMLSAIKYYPNVAMLYIAIENGDFILAGNLALVDQSSFFSGSSVPLPKGAAYNWEIRQSSGDSPK
jgi:hypothetical protein